LKSLKFAASMLLEIRCGSDGIRWAWLDVVAPMLCGLGSAFSSHRNCTLPCLARCKLVNAYVQCVCMRMWLISACNVSRVGCGTVCSC
jgi:hypothetical protein